MSESGEHLLSADSKRAAFFDTGNAPDAANETQDGDFDEIIQHEGGAEEQTDVLERQEGDEEEDYDRTQVEDMNRGSGEHQGVEDEISAETEKHEEADDFEEEQKEREKYVFEVEKDEGYELKEQVDEKDAEEEPQEGQMKEEVEEDADEQLITGENGNTLDEAKFSHLEKEEEKDVLEKGIIEPAAETEFTEVTKTDSATETEPAMDTQFISDPGLAVEPEQPLETEVASDVKKEDITKKEEVADVQLDKEEKSREKIQELDLQAIVTVKCLILPSGQIPAIASTLGQTVGQLKKKLADQLKVQPSAILLTYEGKTVDNSSTLLELNVEPNGIIQLEAQSSDPEKAPFKDFWIQDQLQMTDIINVHIPKDDGNYKDVTIEIEKCTRKKPFLGGYRHKQTGMEYHNAAVQTLPAKKMALPYERFSRDTQTVQLHHVLMQTSRDTSTQMTKIGCYVSNLTDKVIVPRAYTTAENIKAVKLEKVVILQKYLRQWLAKKYVKKLRKEKEEHFEWQSQQEEKRVEDRERRVKREFDRRLHPKTRHDFELLYHALEKWRLEELYRINMSLTGAERKAALYMLLDQETELLAAIDRHKRDASLENKQKFIQNFLNKTAASKTWTTSYCDSLIVTDTPYIIRARELKEIYNSLNMKYLTQDERLDLLLTLKHTVKEHDCKLTQELVELINREADLTMRNVKDSHLDGLRKRISTLFLQYIQTPTFNPEVAKYLKVPQDPTVLRKNIYFCPSCSSYLPSTEFPITSNSNVVGICRMCKKMDNRARMRWDFSQYRHILRVLQQTEEKYAENSKIAFLLQETDIQYLIEKIWSRQSIISAWKDLYDLIFVRWDWNEEWSPWNCILLTEKEAKVHLKLPSLEEGYGKAFIEKVQKKHTLARSYFLHLPELAKTMRSEEDMLTSDLNGTLSPCKSQQTVGISAFHFV